MAEKKTLTVNDVKAMLKGTFGQPPLRQAQRPALPESHRRVGELVEPMLDTERARQSAIAEAKATADKSDLYLGTIGEPVQEERMKDEGGRRKTAKPVLPSSFILPPSSLKT